MLSRRINTFETQIETTNQELTHANYFSFALELNVKLNSRDFNVFMTHNVAKQKLARQRPEREPQGLQSAPCSSAVKTC